MAWTIKPIEDNKNKYYRLMISFKYDLTAKDDNDMRNQVQELFETLEMLDDIDEDVELDKIYTIEILEKRHMH